METALHGAPEYSDPPVGDRSSTSGKALRADAAWPYREYGSRSELAGIHVAGEHRYAGYRPKRYEHTLRRHRARSDEEPGRRRELDLKKQRLAGSLRRDFIPHD